LVWGFGGYEVFDSVLVKEPCFYSNMILVRDKFWNKGFGSLIKKHQLKFARDSLKCNSLYSKVSIDNKYSIRIQKKFGASLLFNRKEYLCVFDFDRVNL
jgi:RimJ/RimL family protein N-acetyltransferase